MRDYQRKYKGQHMPHTLYRKMMCVVRDYDRQKEQIQNIYFGSTVSDGGGKHGKGAPTESKAIRAAAMSRETDAVDKALKCIPPEYRMPIFDNIRYGYKFEKWVSKMDMAGRNTWSRWRLEFLWRVAEYLNLI